MLEPDVRSQRRHRRGLALSLDGLTYLNIDVRHAATRHRQMHGFDPGHGSLHRAKNFALLCQTDDPMGVADHHVVPIGILAVSHRGYFEQRTPALRADVARVFTERPLGLAFAFGHISFDHDFSIRGH